MVQVQEEYLGLMGERLGWYLSVMEEIEREERPPRQVVRPDALPLQPRDMFEQMQRPWAVKSKRKEEFWDCSDLDAIEESEHRNSAVTGSGNSAPAQVLAMSNA
jgi:hypothetical protein